MRCNFCDGRGMRAQGAVLLPCPECGGCGVAHCCDGIQACCEVEGDTRLDPRSESSSTTPAPAKLEN